MDPVIKQRWINALRSGKYKQGTGALRDSKNKFCCLGVLCDLLGVELQIGWANTMGGSLYTFDETGSVLPFRVIEHAGLNENNPIIKLPGRPYQTTTLATRNDAGDTFDHIADLIESSL